MLRDKYPTVREIFGSMVFDRRAMKEKLNQDVYERLVAAMEGRQKLDAGLADTVAMAMRDWAVATVQIGRASCRERV